MYQNCWTPVTPRAWSGRSSRWMVVPAGLTVNVVVGTGEGPATAFPGSKKPTSVTPVRFVPEMSIGCKVPDGVPAGYAAGVTLVSVALLVSLGRYSIRASAEWPLLGCASACGPKSHPVNA